MNWYCNPLEQKSAMEVLALIHERPGMTKTEVMRIPPEPEGRVLSEKTRYERLNHLIKVGLIEVRTEGPQWNSTGLYLTPHGECIAELAMQMNRVMEDLYVSIPADGE